MPTTFTSLRVKGAAYVGGALTIVGASVFAAITATSGEFSGMVEAGTLSGSVIDAATLSGEHLNIKTATNGVACVTSGSKLGICSSAVGAAGDCTCTAL